MTRPQIPLQSPDLSKLREDACSFCGRDATEAVSDENDCFPCCRYCAAAWSRDAGFARELPGGITLEEGLLRAAEFFHKDGEEEAAFLLDQAICALGQAPNLLIHIEEYNALIERMRGDAQFLLDRLDELDFSLSMDDFAREHHGHVDPAMGRLRSTLASLPSTPGGEG